MIPTTLRTAAASKSRMALASSLRLVAKSTTTTNRFFSDSGIEVEHGRGQWKTYGDVSNYTPGKYQIKTLNKISKVGLARFPSDNYEIRSQEQAAANAHAILLRSYKLKADEVVHTVRAIARYVTCLMCNCDAALYVWCAIPTYMKVLNL
jgi:hypothetical protein